MLLDLIRSNHGHRRRSISRRLKVFRGAVNLNIAQLLQAGFGEIGCWLLLRRDLALLLLVSLFANTASVLAGLAASLAGVL